MSDQNLQNNFSVILSQNHKLSSHSTQTGGRMSLEAHLVLCTCQHHHLPSPTLPETLIDFFFLLSHNQYLDDNKETLIPLKDTSFKLLCLLEKEIFI